MRKEEICDVYPSVHVVWVIEGGGVRGRRGGSRNRGENLKECHNMNDPVVNLKVTVK